VAALGPDGTRIIIPLPIGDVAEHRAAAHSVDYVIRTFGGLTHSVARPHVFDGLWINSNGTIVRDEIMLLLIDTEFSLGDTLLQRKLRYLLAKLKNEYLREGKPQDVIYITVHAIVVWA
jgi:hypothetical protein